MRQRSGFTLVELSIVLVIIGLLIGGILAAQSMISTAKINAQVRQIGQFDAAVMNFKEQFNYLPGDAPTFGGDGDGLIAFSPDSSWNKGVPGFHCDIANFFANAFPEAFVSSPRWSSGTWPVVVTTGPAANSPLAKAGKDGSYFIASALSADGWNSDLSKRQNYYAVLDPSQAKVHNYAGSYTCFKATDSANSAFTPAELLALDIKMDDGVANTGVVLSGAIGDGYAGYGGIVSTPLATCSSGPTYQVQNISYECTPLIRIGGSVGIPQ